MLTVTKEETQNWWDKYANQIDNIEEMTTFILALACIRESEWCRRFRQRLPDDLVGNDIANRLNRNGIMSYYAACKYLSKLVERYPDSGEAR